MFIYCFPPRGGGSDTFGDALKESVINGEFSIGQLSQVLIEAREEIYARAGQLENADYETARAYQLTQAELYLATSRLYERYAEKVALKFPESNLAGVGSVQVGADTPSPLEKMETWHRIANHYRAMGERLLTGQGQGWDIKVGTLSTSSTSQYPACLQDITTHATIVVRDVVTMTDEELNQFDYLMDMLKSGLTHWAKQAQETDRDDVLAHIHGMCQDNIDLLSEGITKGYEDDDFDLDVGPIWFGWSTTTPT